jgi:hypothetical protein
MDVSSYRRNSDLDKKNEIHYHSSKKHFKMSKIAKFACELLSKSEENIALWSSQILYIFASRAEKITIFEPKVVIFTARNTNVLYKICELHRAIFSSFYNN